MESETCPRSKINIQSFENYSLVNSVILDKIFKTKSNVPYWWVLKMQLYSSKGMDGQLVYVTYNNW